MLRDYGGVRRVRNLELKVFQIVFLCVSDPSYTQVSGSTVACPRGQLTWNRSNGKRRGGFGSAGLGLSVEHD